jgi:hypothetical protein
LGGLLLCLVGGISLAEAAQPQSAKQYAVYSSTSVQLETYSTVLGPAYSGGNLQLDFGYGIQRPAQNAGDFYARGNYSLGLLSDVTGNVFANGNVTLDSSTDVNGNIVHGGTYTSSGSVTGSVTQQAGSVASVALPPATSFTPGIFDSIHNTDFTLAPGSYGVVEQNGLFKSVHLSSGTYYMSSLSLLNSTSLYLDFAGLEPIKVYVQGNINLDSGFDVYVNGVQVGNGNNGLQTVYAGLTLFETHGNFNMDSGFLNYFYGTIFAPYGSVTVDTQDMFGSILAAGPVTGNTYLSLRESQLVGVPEPGTAVLLACGAAAVIVAGRRRRHARSRR